MRDRLIEDVKRHVLPPDQLRGFVDVLTILLAAPEGSSYRVTAEAPDGAVASALLPPTAYAVVIDALSLLAARDRVALVALDDSREIRLSEAAELLAMPRPTLDAQRLEKNIPHRDGPDGLHFQAGDLLAAYSNSPDADDNESGWRPRRLGSPRRAIDHGIDEADDENQTVIHPRKL